ncbi:hypothetical protein AVEN_268439-1 [Araneus ventricosus]|uniref:Uncharacterized protein n=1 Tax=Araneus ventricosus TaxID=182803 RepID=A0A4Y2JH10_ARAVE|nr:hypothetical protein AVEN_268439-1 [Araneus ventricosus]
MTGDSKPRCSSNHFKKLFHQKHDKVRTLICENDFRETCSCKNLHEPVKGGFGSNISYGNNFCSTCTYANRTNNEFVSYLGWRFKWPHANYTPDFKWILRSGDRLYWNPLSL